MLMWLVWGAVGTVLVNLLTIVALQVAYAWHHGLKPRLLRRRATRRSFARLVAESIVENRATTPEPDRALASQRL